jgi:hypothetical protein
MYTDKLAADVLNVRSTSSASILNNSTAKLPGPIALVWDGFQVLAVSTADYSSRPTYSTAVSDYSATRVVTNYSTVVTD